MFVCNDDAFKGIQIIFFYRLIYKMTKLTMLQYIEKIKLNNYLVLSNAHINVLNSDNIIDRSRFNKNGKHICK